MTLFDFLHTLQSNVSVTVKDTEGIIIEFESPGYGALKAEIAEREIESWTMDRSTAVSVMLKAVVDG